MHCDETIATARPPLPPPIVNSKWFFNSTFSTILFRLFVNNGHWNFHSCARVFICWNIQYLKTAIESFFSSFIRCILCLVYVSVFTFPKYVEYIFHSKILRNCCKMCVCVLVLAHNRSVASTKWFRRKVTVLVFIFRRKKKALIIQSCCISKFYFWSLSHGQTEILLCPSAMTYFLVLCRPFSNEKFKFYLPNWNANT